MLQTVLNYQLTIRFLHARKIIVFLVLLLFFQLHSAVCFAQNMSVDPYFGQGTNPSGVPNSFAQEELEQGTDTAVTLYSSEPTRSPLFEDTSLNDPIQGLVESPTGFEPAIQGPGYDFGANLTQSSAQPNLLNQPNLSNQPSLPNQSNRTNQPHLPTVAMNGGPQYPSPQPLNPPTVPHQQPYSAPYQPQFPGLQGAGPMNPGQMNPGPTVQGQELPRSTTAVVPPPSPLLNPAQTTVPAQSASLGGQDSPAAPIIDGNMDRSNIIIDVRVVGNGQIPLDKIRQKVKSRPNRPFNELQLEEDKRALTQTGWFVDVRPNIYRGQDGVTITFELIEFPLLHYVKFVGNKAYAKKRLLEEAGIAPGDALDPMSVMQAKTRIEEFYKGTGHHKIHVEVLRGDQSTDRGAIFLVSEGGKQRVLKTEFIGNTVAPGGRLKKLIESKPGILYYIGGEFTREKLDEDVEKLIAYYRGLGFFFAKIDRDYSEGAGYLKMGADDAWITVRFIIDEGPRCKISNLTLTGNAVISDQAILEEMKKIKVGSYYNQMGLETDILKIKDLYGRQGRVFTEVVPDYIVDSPSPNEGIVDLTLKIRESKPCKFGDVTVDILGADGGKESYTKISTVLNRGPRIRPNKEVDTEEIRNTERRLKYSQLFNANPMQGYLPEVIFDVDEKTRAQLYEDAVLADQREGITRGQSGFASTPSPSPLSNPASSASSAPKVVSTASSAVVPVSNAVVPASNTVSTPSPTSTVSPVLAHPAAYPENSRSNNRESNNRESQPEINMQQMIRNQLRETDQRLEQTVPTNPNSSFTVPNKMVVRGQTARSMPSLPSSTSSSVVYSQPNYQQPAYQQPTSYTNNPVATPVATQPVNAYAQYGSVDPNNPNQQYQPYSVLPYQSQDQSAQTGVAQTQSAQQTQQNQQTQQSPYTQNTQVAASQPVSAIPFSAPTPPPSPYSSTSTVPTTQSAPSPYYVPNNAAPAVEQPYYAPNYTPNTSGATNPYANSSGAGGMFLAPQPYVPGPRNPSTQGGGLLDSVMPGSTGLQDHANSVFSPKPEPMLTVPAKIRVMETQTGQLMASVGVNSDSGLVARFLYKEDNFDWRRPPKNPLRWEDWRNAYRGAGQRFKIEAMPGTQVQRYEVGWEEPYFLNTDVSLGLTGYYYNRIYTEWSEQRAGGTISLGYKLTPDLTVNSYYKGESVDIYKPIMYGIPDLDRALGTSALHTFGVRLTHDTRDNPNLATEGHMVSVGAEQILGSYQYPRLFADARKYYMLRERPDTSGRWVLGFRSAASWTDIDTPIFERYYAGGFTTIRGFDFRGVSPRWNGVPIGGNFEFYNGAELLFPISADDMIRGVFFVDTGCVQPNIDNWAQKYRVAPGFGLRISIPFMGPAPIAFDFAFPIMKDSTDDVNIFSFYIGWMR